MHTVKTGHSFSLAIAADLESNLLFVLQRLRRLFPGQGGVVLKYLILRASGAAKSIDREQPLQTKELEDVGWPCVALCRRRPVAAITLDTPVTRIPHEYVWRGVTYYRDIGSAAIIWFSSSLDAFRKN